MNDYSFGNRLYEMRKQNKLSQAELGSLIGVTNKAVSKWESGKAKPRSAVLRELAIALNTPIEDMFTGTDATHQPQITRIVITGGPCAGKTTAMSWIQNTFSSMGFTVLFVPETATELITGGIAPWTCGSNKEFQCYLLELQRKKEGLFFEAAKGMNSEKVLIVCDRGILDNKAYMTEAEFQYVLGKLQTNEIELRDNYDAIFHMVTAANGAEEFYTLSNNIARTETIQQAREIDKRLMEAWTGHPHLRVVDNSTSFEDKLRRLLAEISAVLGEPVPLEIERKFLIRYPDIKKIDSLSNCEKIEIMQTYLHNRNSEEEDRIRQRGKNGHYIYTRTIKKKLSDTKRIEIETRLTQAEYLKLLMDADPDLRQIRKTRYCMVYDNQYFEIDIFPFWETQAIVEIELKNEDDPIRFPPDLHVIREVTMDEKFFNRALAEF